MRQRRNHRPQPSSGGESERRSLHKELCAPCKLQQRRGGAGAGVAPNNCSLRSRVRPCGPRAKRPQSGPAPTAWYLQRTPNVSRARARIYSSTSPTYPAPASLDTPPPQAASRCTRITARVPAAHRTLPAPLGPYSRHRARRITACELPPRARRHQSEATRRAPQATR